LFKTRFGKRIVEIFKISRVENWKIITEKHSEDSQDEIDQGNQKVIPVMEEHLHVGTKIVETGRVHVSKKVRTENYDADLAILKEEVIVEKRPVNQYIDGDAPGIRLDGDTTIIPVIKEVIVKRLLLVEELHITKHRTETIVPVHEELRREEVTVTRSDSLDTGAL
jgi:uncharacterized protein (TIGR02271 family)